MYKQKPIDSYASFRLVEKQVEGAVKRGELSKEKAKETLEGARIAYRDQHLNKELSRRGMLL